MMRQAKVVAPSHKERRPMTKAHTTQVLFENFHISWPNATATYTYGTPVTNARITQCASSVGKRKTVLKTKPTTPHLPVEGSLCVELGRNRVEVEVDTLSSQSLCEQHQRLSRNDGRRKTMGPCVNATSYSSLENTRPHGEYRSCPARMEDRGMSCRRHICRRAHSTSANAEFDGTRHSHGRIRSTLQSVLPRETAVMGLTGRSAEFEAWNHETCKAQKTTEP